MKLKFSLILLGLSFLVLCAEENLFETMNPKLKGSVVAGKDENGITYDFSGYSAVMLPYAAIADASAGELSFRVKIKYNPMTDEKAKNELRNQMFFSIIQGRRRFDISMDVGGFLYVGLSDNSDESDIKPFNKRFKSTWAQDQWVAIHFKWGKAWQIKIDETEYTMETEGLFIENMDASKRKLGPQMMIGCDPASPSVMSEFMMDQLKLTVEKPTVEK